VCDVGVLQEAADGRQCELADLLELAVSGNGVAGLIMRQRLQLNLDIIALIVGRLVIAVVGLDVDATDGSGEALSEGREVKQ